MTQAKIHRFDFGALRDFRGPIVVETLKHVNEAEFVPPPAPVFSEAELEAARTAGKKEGYAEGFAAGQQEAKQAADQRMVDAQETLRQLEALMQNLQGMYENLLREESKQLSQLTLSIAKKVADEALDARSADVITALVERCIPVIFSKPRLSIELHPDVLEHTLDRLEALLRENSIEAEIQFRANPELAPSDVSVDWGSGQMARDTKALWNEIQGIINHVPMELDFTSPTPTEATTEQQENH